MASALVVSTSSCEKEEPAKTMSGNYSGILEGKYDGVTLLETGYPVRVSVVSKNKVLIEGDAFSNFEALVTQQGINVDPVSVNENMRALLYSGADEELSFIYVSAGDSASYIGKK